MLDILKVLETCWKMKSKAAIATIVQTSGSTYWLAGAKSVILPHGAIYGMLSGGGVDDFCACCK